MKNNAIHFRSERSSDRQRERQLTQARRQRRQAKRAHLD